MKRVTLIAICFVAACSAVPHPTAVTHPPVVEGPKLAPIDEGASDPSFAEFRSNLLEAVRRHDATALIASVDPKIRTTFGAGGGVSDFRKQWRIEDPRSPVWTELERILTLGGTFTRNAPAPQFWAPYVYSAWPESQDAFSSLAIIATDVPLHQDASQSSPAIATLSLDIVQRGPATDNERWTDVVTKDGRNGWVETKFARSPIGYRAGFVKTNGKWRMNALVAGD